MWWSCNRITLSPLYLRGSSLYHNAATLLSPSPTSHIVECADLSVGEGLGRGKRDNVKSIRARFADAPSPAFGTLSHKWERGKQ